MTTFVLIPGAWRGSWLWQRVRRELQAMGHEVFTPSLTGVADRLHLATPAVDLETHIADVLNLVQFENLDDFVLCGHSYAGCVVTGVADRIPEKIRALVYMDAFVLEDGQSLHDAVPPELAAMQVQAAMDFGNGWQVPPPPAAAFNVNEADRAWVDAQCTPHPLATLRQPLRLLKAMPPDKVTHVLATDYQPSPFGPFHEFAKRKGWKTLEVHAGHDLMLDCQDEVIQILLDASRPSPQQGVNQ